MLRPGTKWKEDETMEYADMSRSIWNEQKRALIAYLSQNWEQILEEQEEARA